MQTIIDFFSNDPYALLLLGAFLLVWLYWLPKVLAPILISRYGNFSPKLKAAVQLALPTIERALLNSWDSIYNNTIIPMTEDTVTPIDDKVWAEVDEIIQRALDQEPEHDA
jgi:hypothetical protein